MITITMKDGVATAEIFGDRREILETLLKMVKSNVIHADYAEIILKKLEQHEKSAR